MASSTRMSSPFKSFLKKQICSSSKFSSAFCWTETEVFLSFQLSRFSKFSFYYTFHHISWKSHSKCNLRTLLLKDLTFTIHMISILYFIFKIYSKALDLKFQWKLLRNISNSLDIIVCLGFFFAIGWNGK